jgi:hypothetical protein
MEKKAFLLSIMSHLIIEEPIGDRGGKVTIDARKNLLGRIDARWDEIKHKFFTFYVWFVNFVDSKIIPSRFRSHSVEDNSRPPWAQWFESILFKHRKGIKMFVMGLLIVGIISIFAPIFTIISDSYNDTDMLIELKLLDADKSAHYINYKKDRATRGESGSLGPKCACPSPGEERDPIIHCYNPDCPNDYDDDENDSDDDGEGGITAEKMKAISLFNPSEICGIGGQFQTYWSSRKVFCWDAVQYLLDTKYNKPMKKKRGVKEETGDFNCLCSDYFGLDDIDFVYMGYKGKESTLLIAPQILPYEKSKKAEYFSMSMEQNGDVGDTHKSLSKLTLTESPISQQSTVKASYYAAPSAEQLHQAYPWASDIHKGVNNLKFSEMYTASTGIYAFDWIISAVKFADSFLNDGRRDCYAITTFMEARIKKAPTEKPEKKEGILNWMNRQNFDKSKPRSLVHVKESEFPIPYGTCVLHCTRLRDSINKKK